MVAAIAAITAVIVTRPIANKQLDLQERQLKKDLFDRRFKIFTDTDEFLGHITSSPSTFTPSSEEYRKFFASVEAAEVLCGQEVKTYLKDTDETAKQLSADHQRMARNPGDNEAIEMQAIHFQHLSDLRSKRLDALRSDLSIG